MEASMSKKNAYKVAGNKKPKWLLERGDYSNLNGLAKLMLLAMRDEYAKSMSKRLGASIGEACEIADDALNRGYIRIDANNEGLIVVPTEQGFAAVDSLLADVLKSRAN
jgi:hypothetical protein